MKATTIDSRLFRQTLLPAALVASIAAPVSAQENQVWELEEMIVTAQKRPQSLQDVPISVSAISGDKMAEAGLNNLEGLATYVPNFSINQTGISTTISIRGISSGINQGFEQSVGMYVDGIYHGRAQLARAPLFDLERVEVLRGPQGILFGKNSIAGAVSMTTAKPTDEFEASLTALYEPDHGEVDLRAVVSGPLGNNLYGRLAVLDRSMDGYMSNSTTGDDEPDKEEQLIRGTLVWDITPDTTATLKVEKSTFDVKGRNIEVMHDTASETGAGLSTVYPFFSGGVALDADQDFRRQANGDSSNNDTENLVLTLETQWGENTITSVTGYSAYEYDELCDCEYTGLNTFTLGLDEEFDQFSQELRIVSPEGNTLDYIAGVFYQQADLEFHDEFQVPEGSALTAVSSTLAGYNSQREFEQDSELWAAFAQVTWNINETLRLTLGGRYSSETKEASRDFFSSTAAPNPVLVANVTALDFAENILRAEPHFVEDERDENSFTPLVNLQYDLNENTMVYATWTTGYKSGGFDVRSNASPDPSIGVPAAITSATGQPPSPVGVFEFEEEEASTFELGTKMTLADGAAELNVALYRTEFDDLQVSIFDGGLGFNVGNAARAKIEGIEFDGRWRLTEALTLSGSLGYLDFEFEDYKNGECYFRQGELEPSTVTNAALDMCSFDGKRQAYTPEWTGNLSADYATNLTDSLEFRAVVDLIYSDSYLTSPSLDPRTEQDSYTKINARLSLGSTDGNWELALIGKNLTDESILTYSAEVPTSSLLVSAATGAQGLAYYGFYDRPRSVALQATLRF
ncbi:TonB-dependent receptor [Pseudomaricurvus alkylphenolicus]|uniref:TonB-dependent receptor n=1 Tax=Pseudomaricurvus alkylphenolicus TaxID=1306991 RepID=UPI0014207CD3|nr:TonB-dependent receptor [Pseudomaricurvus alkylphenolicus]NIB40362.1 TonB-dependent receptor [Pseudomaricurvus alkylphenolicus]